MERPGAAPGGPVLDAARCRACGLCAAACPAGALEPVRPVGEPALLAALAVGPDVSIRCGAAPSAEGPIPVPCIGAVDPAALVLAAALGAQSVTLVDPGCGGCSLRRSRPLARWAVARARALLATFGCPTRVGVAPPAPASGAARASASNGAARDVGLSRRAFLRSLADRPAARRGPPARFDEAARRCPPAGRVLLGRALGLLRPPRTEAASGGRAGLHGFAAGPGCDGCGICAAFCPTGALATTVTAQRVTLELQPLWCTGCGLCVSRCPRGVLAPASPDLATVLADGRTVLAAAAPGRCEACGRPLEPGEAHPHCPDCRVAAALAASFARDSFRPAAAGWRGGWG